MPFAYRVIFKEILFGKFSKFHLFDYKYEQIDASIHLLTNGQCVYYINAHSSYWINMMEHAKL